MTPDLLTYLTTILSWLTGRLLLRLAHSHHWTDQQKKAIPVTALLVGAAFHGGGTAYLSAGAATAKELLTSVVLGAFAGAAAVAFREITKAQKPAEP